MLKFEGKKKVTSDLGFKPDMTIGGLCHAFLTKVEVIEQKVDKVDDKNVERDWEYAGFTIPKLQFTFIQKKEENQSRDRILRHTEDPLTTIGKDGTPIEMDTITAIFEAMNDRIVHIHETFKGTPNYLPLTNLELDIKGDTKAKLESHKVMFTAIAKSFNEGKEGKPIFVDAKGKSIPVYLKIQPDYKTKAFYTIPKFVGKGFIERNVGVPPLIELSPKEKDLELRSKKGDKIADAGGISPIQHQEINKNVQDLIDD